jgi:predicted RNA-binding Zn-ribbon protein involved in translation (DUF1610 family)
MWRRESGKRVKRNIIITLVLFYPVLYLIVRPLYILFNKEWIITFYALVWFVTFIIAIIPLGRPSIICPKCGKHFFASAGWSILDIGVHILLRFRMYRPINAKLECAHCGLKMPHINIVENAA